MAKKQRNYDNITTYEDFIKNVKIPEKMWKFFENIINEKSDTLGNAVKSYHKAGYAETSTSKYRARDLYNSAIMQKLIYLYHKKESEKRINRNISVFDRTDNDLLWCIDRAREVGDYQAVRAASMDRAKLHGQLIDKHQVIDPYTEQAIEQTKAKEAALMAESRLIGESIDDVSGVFDAAFLPVLQDNKGDCTNDLYNDEIETAILSQ
jgi:hypothetical protein